MQETAKLKERIAQLEKERDFWQFLQMATKDFLALEGTEISDKAQKFVQNRWNNRKE